MFRHRVRPPTPPLDEITAERLLRGAPIEDLPDAYRPLGLLLAAATAPATDEELAGSAAAAAEFVAAHEAARSKRRTRSVAGSVFLAFTLAATTGTAVAATQGALPQPIQQVAHEALGAVGIHVPGITKSDDGGDHGDGPVDATPAAATDGDPTPSTTTPAVGAATVPTTPPTDAATGAVTDPAADGEHVSEGGDNPNAGAGNNSGQGNPNPGVDQGNPDPGGANQGNQNEGNNPSEPASNLPSPSNGIGNGPPQTPPGQAKKPG